MRRLAVAVALVLGCGACGRDAAPKPAVTNATDDAAIASVDAAADVSAVPPPKFADLLRRDQYEEAAKTIDALPDAERTSPETHYARARVALWLVDGARAITELDGLEAKLPALDQTIAETRARAQLLVGPFDAAATFFEAQRIPDDQLAAQAFVKAKDEPAAAKACAIVLATERRSRRQEAAEARSIRMKLSTSSDTQIAQDARWLVIKAPDLAFADGADATLAKHDKDHPLTGKELAESARLLADAAKLDAALDALAKAARAKTNPLAGSDLKRAQADARMRARAQYTDAAKLWLECANASGGTAEDLLSSARALSRADDDDAAILRYADVAKKFAKTPQAADASFLSARLQMLHGRWKLAAEAFDDYLKKYPAGGDRDSATKLRAIARLGNGENGVAKKLLETIAASERDAGVKARYQNLAAVAAFKDGDKTHATATWTEVARSQPLTPWAALVARARLTAAGAPLPTTIDPAKSETAAPLTVTLPPPVDLLTRIGLDGDAEHELRSREGSVSAAAPQRSVEATCMAYGMLGRAERRFQVAQQIANATVQTAPSASTRWAWSCLFPEPFADIVSDVELKETLPRGLIYAVMRQESGFDADVVSPARAIGLLQLLPETAKAVAKELAIAHDDAWLIRPAHNIALGGHYLHGLLVKFAGAMPLAIASYNAGPEAAGRWRDRMKGLDLDALVEAIPYAETRGYVVRVMGNLARYAYARAGDTGLPDVKLAL